MSFSAQSWFKLERRKRRLSKSAAAVLEVLADRANNDGVAFPSHTTLARDTGYSTRATKAGVRELRDRLYVQVITDAAERAVLATRAEVPHLSRRVNMYRVLCQPADVAAREKIDAQLHLDLNLGRPLRRARKRPETVAPLSGSHAEPEASSAASSVHHDGDSGAPEMVNAVHHNGERRAPESITESTREPLREPGDSMESGESVSAPVRTLARVDRPAARFRGFHKFDELWSAYPYQRNYGPAERQYRLVIESGDATHADLMAGLAQFVMVKEKPKELRFWLADQNWLDRAELNSASTPAAMLVTNVDEIIAANRAAWRAQRLAEDAARA